MLEAAKNIIQEVTTPKKTKTVPTPRELADKLNQAHRKYIAHKALCERPTEDTIYAALDDAEKKLKPFLATRLSSNAELLEALNSTVYIELKNKDDDKKFREDLRFFEQNNISFVEHSLICVEMLHYLLKKSSMNWQDKGHRGQSKETSNDYVLRLAQGIFKECFGQKLGLGKVKREGKTEDDSPGLRFLSAALPVIEYGAGTSKSTLAKKIDQQRRIRRT